MISAAHPDTNNEGQNKNIRLIIAARFFSDFGAFLNMIALTTYVYVLTQDVVQISIFLACRVLGGIVASIVGVPFFRRIKGHWSLIAFDLTRALLLAMLLALPSTALSYVLPLIALGLGFGNSMFAIGLNSQLPWWVHKSQWVTTNAWLTSVSAVGAVAGSLISGMLLVYSGFESVFIINIVIYLLAGACVVPLRFLQSPQDAPQGGPLREWRNLRAGLGCAPVLAGMLVVTIADTLGSAAHNVGFPVFSELLDSKSAGHIMGLLLAVWAAGKFAGARMTEMLLRKALGPGIENLFLVGVVLMSLGFIATFQQTSLSVALVCVAVAGLGDGISDVSLVSRIQQEPEALRLPVFSLMTFLQMTGFGIGMLVVAPFYIWFQPSVVIVIFHGLPLLAATITWGLASRRNLMTSDNPSE